MTAKIVFKMDCPACGKHVATKADLLTKEVTEDEITATIKLDHNSWYESHGDDDCALKDLSSMEEVTDYDSTADTLKHSLRVGELVSQTVKELIDRSLHHDISKTQPPELETFNEYTPKLKHSTYGSDEYKEFLAGMKPALDHHYAHNRHHPEHFKSGINDMTLIDLIEMLADWKAATERHADGDLFRSLEIQKERFGISDQLAEILDNTAAHFGWIGKG